MNNYTELKAIDKTASVLIFLSLSFWSLSKVPYVASFPLFAVLYESIWLYMIVIALFTTFYFLYKWIAVDLKIKTIYFYGFLIGTVTLAIMRFVQL